MRRLLNENSSFFLTEDGVGFILLERDWDNEPGAGVDMWTPASSASGASWTPVSDTSNPNWSQASDSSGASWTPVDGGSNTWTEEDGS